MCSFIMLNYMNLEATSHKSDTDLKIRQASASICDWLIAL